MNQISKIFLLPAAFFCFAACSNDDGFAPAQGDGSGSPVVVRAAVGDGGIYTRTNPDATDADEQKKFREGDKIKIIDADHNFESDYILNADGVWQPADPASFLKWQSRKGNHFQGVYPADGRNTFVKWHVEKDQTTLEGLRASDVMTYDAGDVDEPGNHILNVEFKRQTARLVVEIASYRDQYNATDNPVTALTVSGCEIDNSSDEQQGDVQAYKLPGEQRFVALVLGGTREREQDVADSTFLTLTVKNSQGGDDVLTVKGVPSLEAGNSYNLKLAIGKDKAEIASVTVNPWNDGGEIIPGDKEAGVYVDDPNAIKSLRSPIFTQSDLGKVITSDGNVYPTLADVQAAGANPVAMIAYVGPNTGDSEHTRGLGFALTGVQTETNSDKQWALNSYRANTPVPTGGGEWRIPSRADLQRIFYAFGGSRQDRLIYNYGTFYEKLNACGSSEMQRVSVGPVIYASEEYTTFVFCYGNEDPHVGRFAGSYVAEVRCIFAF